MSRSRQSLGRWGEKLAADFLNEHGYIVLEKNVRTPYGELDLVTRQGEVIVFVEVKTRTSSVFGYPEEAITPRKQEHLLASAQDYLQAHPELSGDWRVDVISIECTSSEGTPEIKHFENAIFV